MEQRKARGKPASSCDLELHPCDLDLYQGVQMYARSRPVDWFSSRKQLKLYVVVQSHPKEQGEHNLSIIGLTFIPKHYLSGFYLLFSLSVKEGSTQTQGTTIYLY